MFFLVLRFEIEKISTYQEMAIAIKDMHVRGAGLIGAAAAYGMYLAARQASAAAKSTDSDGERAAAFQRFLGLAAVELMSTRPTAVNLEHAVRRQTLAIEGDNFHHINLHERPRHCVIWFATQRFTTSMLKLRRRRELPE